jgi:hypothetical protein
MANIDKTQIGLAGDQINELDERLNSKKIFALEVV